MTLDCEYLTNNEIQYFTLGPDYQCKATVNFNVDSDKTKVTNVSQNHLQGKTNNDVTFLGIRRQDLEFFPKDIEKFFPNLKAIDVGFSEIKKITKDDLGKFPNLRYIDFYKNELTELDDDLFDATPNLQLINFGNNKIQKVGQNTFKPLETLQKLFFHSGSSCVREYAEFRERVIKLIAKISVSCPPTSNENKN